MSYHSSFYPRISNSERDELQEKENGNLEDFNTIEMNIGIKDKRREELMCMALRISYSNKN